MLDVTDHQAVPARADFARVLVVDRGDVKTALAKAVVLDERPAHPSRPDQHDAVAALKAKDVANAARQFGDGVAEAAFAEGAEEGEVFADLGGGGAAEAGQLARGDGGRLGLLEESEVDGQPAHGAVGDLPHCELFHNGGLLRKPLKASERG